MMYILVYGSNCIFSKFAIMLPKRLFAFLLSLYVVALTAVPCCDDMNVKKVNLVELSQSRNPDSQQNESDHCSPFCACNCCQSNFEITPLPVSTPVTALDIFYYDQPAGFQSPVLFDFLVPPKV
jgi:hypothetical protein